MIRFGQIEINGKTKQIRNGPYSLSCSYKPGGGPTPHIRFKAFKYLLCANGNGISREQLFELVYKDQDGPLAAHKVFDIRFIEWAPYFRQLGMQLRREKRGGTIYFRLVPVQQHVV